jgi:D-cysteine desulfhydrase
MPPVVTQPDFDKVALFRRFPNLRSVLPWVSLGDWPTPVERLAGRDDMYVKREDISSALYGGNKVRTLEGQFGRSRAEGARRIWATGAYGSNHAVATLLHAKGAGLAAGALLFPQPPTHAAQENLRATLAADPDLISIPHVAALPLAMAALEFQNRRKRLGDYVMPPGGATPTGALGHVSAGLELAEQVEAKLLAAPALIVLAVGSTCTSAGLLVGLALAERLGIAPAPRVCAVRVTPWPVTAPARIAYLARRTSLHLASLIGDVADIPYRQLRNMLQVDRHYFGGGYGKPTQSGRDALQAMARAGGPPLDLVYSAKSAAAFFAAKERPVLFWATKSSVPLPQASEAQLAAAPWAMRRWLAKPIV